MWSLTHWFKISYITQGSFYGTRDISIQYCTKKIYHCELFHHKWNFPCNIYVMLAKIKWKSKNGKKKILKKTGKRKKNLEKQKWKNKWKEIKHVRRRLRKLYYKRGELIRANAFFFYWGKKATLVRSQFC